MQQDGADRLSGSARSLIPRVEVVAAAAINWARYLCLGTIECDGQSATLSPLVKLTNPDDLIERMGADWNGREGPPIAKPTASTRRQQNSAG